MDIGTVRYDDASKTYVFVPNDEIEWDAELGANCFAAIIVAMQTMDEIDGGEFQAAVMRILAGGGV